MSITIKHHEAKFKKELNPKVGLIALSTDQTIEGDFNKTPNKYSLNNNYPNPFNPMTTISYDLPKDGFVNITIYDMMGRPVKIMVTGEQNAGVKSVQWDAIDSFGKPVSAGVYLYQIKAGEFVQTKKMVLLK